MQISSASTQFIQSESLLGYKVPESLRYWTLTACHKTNPLETTKERLTAVDDASPNKTGHFIYIFF